MASRSKESRRSFASLKLFGWSCCILGVLVFAVVGINYWQCAGAARQQLADARSPDDPFMGLHEGMTEEQVHQVFASASPEMTTSRKYQRIDPPMPGLVRWYRCQYGPAWRPFILFGPPEFLVKEEYEVVFSESGGVTEVKRTLMGRAVKSAGRIIQHLTDERGRDEQHR